LNDLFGSIRKTLIAWISGAGYSVLLFFQSMGWLTAAWEKRKDIVEQIHICAFGGFPVTMIVAVFSGMVLALQTGIELARYGQEENIGYLVSAAMCREMGPVMTGYILAGLIGSTMAAELGTMKVSEEIDALEVMSINPVKYLVMPRVVAMCIVGPIMTIYADFVGIVGGGFVGNRLLGVDKSINVLDLKDIYSGLVKALIFGATIATVGCAQGLRAEHGAEGVGRATMKAVVTGFIFILMFDYILTWVFY
jgi:phospholipid/cholesterol/gamma-HCH transport system permease protein